MSKNANVVMHRFSENVSRQDGTQKEQDDRISTLGEGTFITTYRMRNAYGHVFAIKMV